MAPFFHGLVRFFSHKKGNDTEPSEISNDELVTAYEWVLAPVRIEIDPSTCPPHTTLFVPAEVSDTLRKLGAR